MQKIEFQTSDNIKIVADYYEPNEPSVKGVVLLHMMPATRFSWAQFAEKLRTSGYNVLAIDLRGHGESGGGNYQAFTPEQHQKYYLDAEGGLKFLSDQNPEAKIVFGGASIGANETIKILAEHPKIEKGFALSAGLDYYGVRAIDDVARIRPNQKMLFVGSRDDGRASGNCGEMAEKLYNLAQCQKEKIIYEHGGHGTNLLLSHSELTERLVKFIISD